MLFNQGLKEGEYEVVHEGEDTILRVNYEGSTIAPSLEDEPLCMARTITRLVENQDITKIVFLEKRDIEYGFEQTQFLVEISRIYKKLIHLAFECTFVRRVLGLPRDWDSVLATLNAPIRRLTSTGAEKQEWPTQIRLEQDRA